VKSPKQRDMYIKGSLKNKKNDVALVLILKLLQMMEEGTLDFTVLESIFKWKPG
jgi:hypothetical protein